MKKKKRPIKIVYGSKEVKKSLILDHLKQLMNTSLASRFLRVMKYPE